MRRAKKGRTSEEFAEVRSGGGTSLGAGVTFVSLGLSLLNNFRMGTKSEKRRGQDGVGEGKRDEERQVKKGKRSRLLIHEPERQRQEKPRPSSFLIPSLPSATAFYSTER